MSELNPVRLVKENLDLRAQLDAAQAKIAGLQLSATQAVQHQFVTGGGAAGTAPKLVSIDEFLALERELEQSKRREAQLSAKAESTAAELADRERLVLALQLELEDAKHRVRQAASSASAPTASPVGTDGSAAASPAGRARSSTTTTKPGQVDPLLSGGATEQAKQIALLTRQVEEFKRRNKEQAIVIEELNQALLRSSRAATPDEPPPPSPLAPPPGAPVASAAGRSEEEVQQMINAAVEERLFEYMMEVEEKKVEDDKKLKALGDEVASLRLQLVEAQKRLAAAAKAAEQQQQRRSTESPPPPPTAAVASSSPLSSSPGSSDVDTLRRQLQSAEELRRKAEIERDVAVRVKDGALQECGAARAEKGRVQADLKIQLDLVAELRATIRSHEETESSHRQEERAQRKQDDAAWQSAARAKDQELELLHRQLRQSQADTREAQSALEDTKAQLTAAVARLGDVDHQIAAVDEERRRALAAGAELERLAKAAQTAAAASHEEQLERLKRRFSGDQHAVSSVFSEVVSSYEALMDGLRKKTSNTERDEFIWDVICEYERKMWNQNNDLKSAKTVREIREKELVEDATRSYQSRLEEMQSAVMILRMQVQELGKNPAI